MLSFQIVNYGKEIQAFRDEGGLDELICKLQHMKNSNIRHIHLGVSSAGGNALNDKSPWGGDVVSEVIINTN